jgi:transposase
LVFLDEAVFTFNTMNTKAWFLPYDSVKVRDTDTRIKTQAVVVAVSEDKGFEGYLLHPKSISAPQFIDFLKSLSAMYDEKPFAVFLDNLAVHKTKEVMETYERLNIKPIFNVPYSPQFNGIESYFSLLKGEYKKRLMQKLLKGNKLNTVDLIKTSINQVADEKTRRCIRNGIEAVHA